MPFLHDEDNGSDNDSTIVKTVPQIVMAEQVSQDVVNEAQSMGDASPIGVNATTTNLTTAGDGEAVPDSTIAFSKTPNLPDTPSRNESSADAPRLGIPPLADDSAENTPGSMTPNSGGSQTDGTPPVKGGLVNGDSVDHLSPDDVLNQHILVDTSGGSDTDTSRGEGLGQSKGHIRSNSVKKPTAFKAVSVTKNFLAKTAVSTSSARGDKASGPVQANASVQQTAKPRLVAKSGSGLGTVTRSGGSKLNGAGGPDASKVWNKNQPVPPPPPKQFTDEELKQQYGIHMATRLQADESGKESKWADIDDDEDDWAPETVEWMDGTKSTLKAAENLPPPEEPKPAPAKAENPADSAKSLASATSAAAQRPTSKTILKPGAHSQASQPKAGNLVLKGTPEKPTLVAKPSSATPVKSPWAPLPPVDKVPPVQINPPVQQLPPSRFSQRDPHGFDALPRAPSPTKEIAADDFNRAWRDDRTNKELFNSQSGRYEPVNEMRRGSVRDNSFRQPAVLQRPTNQGQTGPAEPSAAFQTSRTGISDGAAWGRRRNSSNVSGGSGRRLSISRNPDIPPLHNQPIAGSEVAIPNDAARSSFPPPSRGPFAERALSPAGQRQQPWAQRQSPIVNHAQPISPYGSVGSSGAGDFVQGPAPSSSPLPDPVAVQQQLMREKIEKARLEKQRRQEEEAKEEAAKKERLRLKLAALGPPPEAKQDKPKEPNAPTLEPTTQKDKVVPSQSPPKPPVPTADGEVAQYGMIKVHQPHPVRKPGQQDASLQESKAAPRQAETMAESAPPGRLIPSPAKSPNAAQQPARQSTQVQRQEATPEMATNIPHPQAERPTQAWKPVQSDNYPGWAGASAAPRNVWGPPSQSENRALGNGTFDGGYRGQPRPAAGLPAKPQPSVPGPIAPPSAGHKVSPDVSQDIPHHVQGFEHPRPFMPQGDVRSQLPIGPPSLGTVPEPSMGAPSVSRPGPIAPPTRVPSVPNDRQGQRYTAADWQNLPGQLKQQDADALALRKGQLQTEAPVPRASTDVFKESFRQTVPGSGFGKRKVIKTETTLHAPEGSTVVEQVAGPSNKGRHLDHPQQPQESEPSMLMNLDSHAQPVFADQQRHVTQPEDNSAQRFAERGPQVGPTVGNLQPSHAASGGRASRFFPRASEAPSQASETLSSYDSPPPPEITSHPVFEGDVTHPKVHLPVPKARVKLPPVPPSPPKAVIMPARPDPPRLGSQPIVSQTAWQERFNGLFGRASAAQPISPAQVQAKPIAPAVSSVSKAPLDVQRHSATVSLPTRVVKVSTVDYSDEPISKVMTDYLFEDRQHGDTPVIRFPKGPHISAHLPARYPVTNRPNSKFQRNHQPLVFSIDPTASPLPDAEHTDSGVTLQIKFPGASETKNLIVPKSSLPSSVESTPSANNRKRRNFTPRDRENSNSGPNARSRKPSTNHQSPGTGSNASPRGPTHGSGWNNARTNSHGSPWNKRVTSGVVH